MGDLLSFGREKDGLDRECRRHMMDLLEARNLMEDGDGYVSLLGIDEHGNCDNNYTPIQSGVQPRLMNETYE